MIFSSYEFLLFFVTVLLLRGRWRSFAAEKWFLLVASYVFYMSWDPRYALLIFFTSYVDYRIGLWLGQLEEPRARRRALVLSLVLNLGLLGLFKYTNFLLATVQDVLAVAGLSMRLPAPEIVLPVGISFFTFQSMSYTIDVYRRAIPPCRSARDLLLFVAFFPQLVAGPIVRASEFLPQLAARVRPSARDVEVGVGLFLQGAFKKLVISDQVARHVDLIFARPGEFAAVSLLQGLLGYALQIYCDFSGYSDMAVGCARLMGYRFPDNFRMPYAASDLPDFWRRWHISLSTWLRDYLYIPLGGNRWGGARTRLNVLVTMLLGGLWHGASWNFVLWGCLHGAALALQARWLRGREYARGPLAGVAARAFALAVVLLGWIPFRCQTLPEAGQFAGRLLTGRADGAVLWSPQILACVGLVLLVHVLVPRDSDLMQVLPERSPILRIAVLGALLSGIVLFGATDAAPFIYFQF